MKWDFEGNGCCCKYG